MIYFNKKAKDNLELKTDFAALEFEIIFSSMLPNFVTDDFFEEFSFMELKQFKKQSP